MYDDDFDEITVGGWLRSRDYIGHWVLFVVRSTTQRDGDYGTQTVATVDFADLSDDDPELLSDIRLSDQYVVDKLKPGKKIVGQIQQAEPKKKSWKGAIYLAQPKGDGYEQAKAAAKNVLNGSKKKVAPPPPSDDLEDLLS